MGVVGLRMTETERQARIAAIIDEFTLMDDAFMSEVFDGQNEIVGLLLRIILQRDDLVVTSVKTQHEYKSSTMRSVKLDVRAVDASGKIYDIEIQRSDRGTGARRARFYSSMIDRDLLEQSQSFDELVDTYVIFITENDKFRRGLPLYHIERKITELDDEPFGDGAHIIYVNGEYRNANDPIGRLMHDFNCKKAGEMFYPEISERVRYFKGNEEGGNRYMNRLFEEFIKEECADYVKLADKRVEEAEKRAKDVERKAKDAEKKAKDVERKAEEAEKARESERRNTIRLVKYMIKSATLPHIEIAELSGLSLAEVEAVARGEEI